MHALSELCGHDMVRLCDWPSACVERQKAEEGSWPLKQIHTPPPFNEITDAKNIARNYFLGACDNFA